MKINKCQYCGAQPNIIVTSEIYYAQCSNCRKHNQYQFPGRTEKYAIEQWNTGNIKYSKKEQVIMPRPHQKWVYTCHGKKYYTAIDVARVLNVHQSTITDKFRRLGRAKININSTIITREPRDE